MNDFTNTIEAERYITTLLRKVESLTNENDSMRSLLESFWTGDVPELATLDHLVLAKAGRIRLDAKSKVCSLLGG